MRFIPALRARAWSRWRKRGRPQLSNLQEQAELVNLASGAFIVRGLDGRIKFWSRGAEALYGFSSAEAEGRVTHELLGTIFPRPLAEIERQVVEKGFWEGPLRHHRKDGRWVAVESRWALQRDAAGKPKGMLEVNRDVTKRVQVEAALLEKDQLLRAAVEAANLGIWRWDLETGKIYYDERVKDFFGLRPDQPLDRVEQFVSLIHPEDRPAFEEAMRRARDGGEVEHEYRIVRPDGKLRWIFAKGKAVQDENGRVSCIAGASIDITERKAAEMQLRQAFDKLSRSNRELEQFAYIASHDLQEPLRKISSFSDLLRRRFHGRLSAEADRYLDYITAGAKRMSRLITDLLDFSRAGRDYDLRPTPLDQALADALGDLDLLIRRSAARVTVPSPLPVVMADKDRIVQVLQNLISNALKFRGAQPPRVEISAARAGAMWNVTVRDNGIGIDPRYFGQIFQPFKRLHGREEFPGTGIGLAICKKIVECHGGRIWVESSPGRGSAFSFSLPAAKGRP